jgi:hypothetical protein
MGDAENRILKMAVLLILLSRQVPWLHLRVQEKEGRRIAISLPMPMRLMNWGLGLARHFIPKEQAMHLETAAVLVTVMKDNTDQDPIIIDVDDEDGDKVQIFIG